MTAKLLTMALMELGLRMFVKRILMAWLAGHPEGHILWTSTST